MHKLRVLICDDMEHVRLAHEHRIRQIGEGRFFPEVLQAEAGTEAIKLCVEAKQIGKPFDLVLMDVDFSKASTGPEMNGFIAAHELRELSPGSVIVVISAYDTDDNLTTANKSDSIERFFRRDSFRRSELEEVCLFSLLRKLHDREELLSPQDTIYTRSTLMQDYLKSVDRVSHSQNALIYGETGTGKELTAKRLNANAKVAWGQKTRPLVCINCGELTESLRGSELFGYVPGAFTGATKETPGRLEAAEGGDVFLDELQNAPLGLQEALMRVLNDKTFTPVGGTVPKKLNVRFIAALNRDPVQATEAGQLKPDLLPRLQQAYLVIPPLRDRKEDFPYLVERYLQIHAGADKSLTRDAIEFLSGLRWPTNIRGLNNVLADALRSAKIPVITVDTLGTLKPVQDLLQGEGRPNTAARASGLGIEPKMEELASVWLGSNLSLEDALRGFERKVLEKLRGEGQSFAKIASRVKMSETTVRRKLSDFQAT